MTHYCTKYSNLHEPALGGTTGARARALRRLRSVSGAPAQRLKSRASAAGSCPARASCARRASPSCIADEVCVRTDSRCTRTSLRRGIGPRPEDRPLPRGVHAVRAVGSAQLVVGFVRGERRRRGVARRSSRRSRPIGENSDYQTSTPSPRLIRARRILTKRCRGAGAVLRTPRRGAAMTSRPHRAAPAASTTSR